MIVPPLEILLFYMGWFLGLSSFFSKRYSWKAIPICIALIFVSSEYWEIPIMIASEYLGIMYWRTPFGWGFFLHHINTLVMVWFLFKLSGIRPSFFVIFGLFAGVVINWLILVPVPLVPAFIPRSIGLIALGVVFYFGSSNIS